MRYDGCLYKFELKPALFKGFQYKQTNYKAYVDKDVIRYINNNGDEDTIMRVKLDKYITNSLNDFVPTVIVYTLDHTKIIDYISKAKQLICDELVLRRNHLDQMIKDCKGELLDESETEE